MKHAITYILAILAMFAFLSGAAVADSFEGRTKCSSCHKAQAKSWKDTAHAKAMESLKPGTRKEEKIQRKTIPKTKIVLVVTLMDLARKVAIP